jgi:hypothetical protein
MLIILRGAHMAAARMTKKDEKKLERRAKLLEQMAQLRAQLIKTALFPVGFTFNRWGKSYRITNIFIEGDTIRYAAHRIHSDGGLYRRTTVFSETELALMPGVSGKLAT